jgi:hypothetical protein
VSSFGSAFDVETTVTVAYYELGRMLGTEANSTEQAEFLLGFLDAVADQQLAFIGDEKILDDQRGELADMLISLALRVSPDRAAESGASLVEEVIKLVPGWESRA